MLEMLQMRANFLVMLGESRAYFSHLLHALPVRSALFENKMSCSLLKARKTQVVKVGAGLNALNLEK